MNSITIHEHNGRHQCTDKIAAVANRIWGRWTVFAPMSKKQKRKERPKNTPMSVIRQSRLVTVKGGLVMQTAIAVLLQGDRKRKERAGHLNRATIQQ